MTAKTCRVSGCSRPIGGGDPGTGSWTEDASYANSVDLCRPCATEAGWENMHSDHGHETIESLTMAQTSFTARKDFRAYVAEVKTETTECWICHPELNRAQAEYTPRVGTSRAGMVINVPLRASGVEKASHVANLLGERFSTKVVKPTKRNGYAVKLVVDAEGISITLTWDQAGRYQYDLSTATVSGKTTKVRNVAAALATIQS